MAQTRPPSTAAIGWSPFASFMMGLLGVWWVVAALAWLATFPVSLKV